MVATHKAYEALVTEKAWELEEAGNHPASHEGEGVCPSCGQFGQYDLKGFALSASSIFSSTIFGE
jgi:hypothetical protein